MAERAPEDDEVGPAAARRVLVVDNERSFSEAMALALEAHDDLDCVGVALDGAACRALLAEHEVDVVLVDVGLPDVEGVALAREVISERPECDVVVLTSSSEPGLCARAVEAGVVGFLRKDQALDDILDAIGDPRGAEPSLAQQVQAEADAALQSGAPSLTDRERRVLVLLGEGLAPKQIARQLGISVHTARGHVKAILAKLRCHSALEAVVTAQRLGLLAEAEAESSDLRQATPSG